MTKACTCGVADEFEGMGIGHHPDCPLGKKELPPNPKQAYGDLKVPLALVPATALVLVADVFKEGARKYGAYNWRDQPVESMTYIHAALRHIMAFLDGEELDPESDGKPHLAHAMASLAILLDAAVTGNLLDNRPKRGITGDLLRTKAVVPTAPWQKHVASPAEHVEPAGPRKDCGDATGPAWNAKRQRWEWE